MNKIKILATYTSILIQTPCRIRNSSLKIVGKSVGENYIPSMQK
jgi:hypothetical protein